VTAVLYSPVPSTAAKDAVGLSILIRLRLVLWMIERVSLSLSSAFDQR